MVPPIHKNIADNPSASMILRIGIAGPRRMSEQELRFGNEKLSSLLSNISKELTVLIQTKKLARGRHPVPQQSIPTIQLISSLAIGADRLSMTEEVKHCCGENAKLEQAAVLPFRLENCKTGLAEPTRSDALNNQDWRDLKAYSAQIGPRLIELDGDISSPETRDQAHYKCTEYLVENIDLLVVFTKNPTVTVHKLHRAGTATTMRLSKEAGHPVIQVDFGASKVGSFFVNIHLAKTFGSSENNEPYCGESIRKLLAEIVSRNIKHN